MRTYQCLVLINGYYVYARVQADNMQNARWLLEAQYGKANVIQIPTPVS